MKRISLALMVSVLITACSSTQTMSRQEKNLAYQEYIVEQQLPKLDRVRSFNMRGWQLLTESYLIVSASQQKHYLLELKGFCPDLDYASGILLKQTNSSSLTTRFDSVAALNAPRIKCFIKSIHPITPEQEQALTAIGKPEAT